MNLNTYSAASEHLLRDRVASKDEIDRVEQHLLGRRPQQPIVVAQLSIGVVHERLVAILDGYCAYGQLQRREHVRCPRCSTLEQARRVEEARDAEDSLMCGHCGEEDLAVRDPALPVTIAYYLTE